MTRWTQARIPDLTGRTAVVTGANSGLGLQTATQLAAHGAHVVMASRDQGRATAAATRIREAVPRAELEVRLLDLADLTSVREFASAYAERRVGLDILVNNAGVMAIPHRRTADGFEMQLGTNHLGHFALTGLLLPSLLARPGARVVTVGSTAASGGRIDFRDLQRERRYGRWSAYAQSKLANLLFALELDRRARAAGASLVSAAAHPGYAATNLQAAAPRMEHRRLREAMVALANRLFAQSDVQGALPSLYAATAADVRGGDYFGPDGLFGQRGYPRRVSPPRRARDAETARRLWEVSEELTGVRYEALPPVAAARAPGRRGARKVVLP